MDIPPAKSINVILRNGSPQDQKKLEDYRPYLQKLAKLKTIVWLAEGQEAPAAATQLFKELEILVPLAGLIDVEVEITRLSKEIAKLQMGLRATSSKLGNPKFVDNAPEAIVAKEREKQGQMSGALEALQQKLKQLKSV